MPSIPFANFKYLWEKAAEKFQQEKNIDINDLKKITLNGAVLNENDVTNINKKFHQKLEEYPETVNLNMRIYTTLLAYTNLDFPKISKLVNREFEYIDFIGREKEMSVLTDFMQNESKKALILYGLPLIGKTELVEKFIDNESNNLGSLDIKNIYLDYPEVQSPIDAINNALFSTTSFCDFSAINSPTLVIIQNFERVLDWSIKYHLSHDILGAYERKIHQFIAKAIENDHVKLLIESRFRFNYSHLKRNISKVQELQIEGIKKDYYWRYYRTKDITKREFDTICEQFSGHTWLLTNSYNNNNIQDLKNSVASVNFVIEAIWNRITDIIGKLNDVEIWILCCASVLSRPIPEVKFRHEVQQILNKDSKSIRKNLLSLNAKLLANINSQSIRLNPYMKEICFTMLQESYPRRFKTIFSNEFFSQNGTMKGYNKIKQLYELYDYKKLFALGLEYRRKGDYDNAIECFKKGKEIDPNPYFVLNELAISYRDKKPPEIDKAFETLHEALKLSPNNPIVYQVFGRTYKKIGETEEAIRYLNLSIEGGNLQSYSVLAGIYEEQGDIQKAYEIADRGMRHARRKPSFDDRKLRKAYNRLESKITTAKNKPPKPMTSTPPAKSDGKLEEIIAYLKKIEANQQQSTFYILKALATIKHSTDSLENKLDKLSEAADTVNITDISKYENYLSKWLTNAHNLAPQGKDLLIRAEFFFDAIKNSTDNEYSIYIHQYCRAIENEVKTVFKNYRQDVVSRKNQIQLNALLDKHNPNKPYKNSGHGNFARNIDSEKHLQFDEMLKILKKNNTIASARTPLFSDFHQYISITFSPYLFTEDFIDKILDIKNEYRNNVAHPNGIDYDLSSTNKFTSEAQFILKSFADAKVTS